MSTFLARWLFVLIILTSGSAMAQALPEGEEPGAFEIHKVAILPLRTNVILHLKAPKVEGILDPALIRSSLEKHFDGQPYFKLQDTEDLVRDLKQRSQLAVALQDAKDALSDGEMFFFSFNFRSAIASLQRANQKFEQGLGEILAPEEWGRASQLLAFTLLEEVGQSSATPEELAALYAEARKAMSDLTHLAPNVILDPERQTQARLDLFDQARDSYLSDRALRSVMRTRAEEIIDWVDSDYLVFPRVVQDREGALSFEFEVYSRDSGALQSFSGALSVTDEGATRDQVDAIASQFTSCVPPRVAPEEAKESKSGEIHLDMGFTYFVFLAGPTTQHFDNMGGVFRGTYMLNDNLSLTSRLGLVFSGRDEEGDLQSTFNTFRWLVGLGLSFDFEWVRFFFSPGLEVAKPTDFETTNSIYCKVYGADDFMCDPEDMSAYHIDLQTGLSASLGASLGADPLFFFFEANFAFYFLPLDEARHLNFPLGFDLGIEYRF